jgi:autotransporter passenger strand-loop-strand repeat protein
MGVAVNSGGTDHVSGTEIGATLNGGIEVVSHGGVASATTVRSGGSQTGLGVTVATVVSGGTEIASPAAPPSTPASSAGARWC